MIYKASLAFSLLVLAVASSVQSDEATYTSGQPQSASSSVTQTVASQSCPSGSTIPILPTASNNVSSGIHRHHTARPSGCQPYSVIPTVTSSFQPISSGVPSSFQPISSGVPSSVEHSASLVPGPIFTNCQPYPESNIPTMTADVQPYSGAALPTASASLVSEPIPYNATLNGTQPDNSTLTTASSQPVPSGAFQQDPPISTTTASSYGKLDWL